MSAVYILHSKKLNKFYTGSCKELSIRLEQHRNTIFSDSFTAAADDWELFFATENLEYKQARDIENHIKKMKSSKYIQNLKKYPEIIQKLIEKYKNE